MRFQTITTSLMFLAAFLMILCSPDGANAQPALVEYRPDIAFEASSEWHSNYAAEKARFSSSTGWSAKQEDNQWIRVDLGDEYVIHKISTMGIATDDEWVTSYKFKYAVIDGSYTIYPGILSGNNDRNTKQNHTLNPTIIARYIRFEPQEWEWPAMRIEAYGYLFTTETPTLPPTNNPSSSPTNNPFPSPTNNSLPSPTKNPFPSPTNNPSPSPTNNPSPSPTNNPSSSPTPTPTADPATSPTTYPTDNPTQSPTDDPSPAPTMNNPSDAHTENATTDISSTMIIISSEATFAAKDTSALSTLSQYFILILLVVFTLIITCCLCVIFVCCKVLKRNNAKTNERITEMVMTKTVSASQENIDDDSSSDDDIIIPTKQTKTDNTASNRSLVAAWLENVVELPQYYPLFIQNGYGSMRFIEQIQHKSELQEIGINMLGHQTMIMSEIRRLQNRNNYNDAVYGNGFLMNDNKGNNNEDIAHLVNVNETKNDGNHLDLAYGNNKHVHYGKKRNKKGEPSMNSIPFGNPKFGLIFSTASHNSMYNNPDGDIATDQVTGDNDEDIASGTTRGHGSI